MMSSAEIRWFWNSPPQELRTWFCDPGAFPFGAGGGPPARKDIYLKDAGQTELGIKVRGTKGGVEIKSLVEVIQRSLNTPPFVGPIEFWTKVTSEVLGMSGYATVVTEKVRRLRKFETAGERVIEIELLPDSSEKPKTRKNLPNIGCNVEFTELSINSAEPNWWTFGFEAFGPLATLVKSLSGVAHHLATSNPPAFSGALRASYPAWLSEVLKGGAAQG